VQEHLAGRMVPKFRKVSWLRKYKLYRKYGIGLLGR
jgi:hypothetical protein